ncbi:hypothetical protein MU1_22510 [Paenibacillus glycanilyticus]|uniref:Nudix hydrolase domain-containing protein n=1 Tax=Paenibacillus glycanilyticus TaxID=126569 RepID=A0ABQ6GAB3_9BACL|nr:hypothetical protein MU1_22510 [Paenibacillus glycanilyticus]
MPGGTVEADESLAAALLREILEETGIIAEIKENVGACEFLIPYELDKRGTTHIHHIAVFYLVQSAKGTMIQFPEMIEDQDSLGGLWLPLEEITAINSSPLVQQAKEWIQIGKLSFEFKRLDQWEVL